MDFTVFLLQVVLISLSGVMAPGPMSAATIGKGSRYPHAGALISLGHGCIEVPLMMVLLAGLGAFLQFAYVKIIIGLAGGIVLFVMGIDMARLVFSARVDAADNGRSPFVTGIILSAANPYFLLWWATIGMTLIVRSAQFGPAGIAAFAIVHWLCDFIWLWFLSALSYKGGRFFGNAFQKAVFAVCAVVLAGFGIKFCAEALRIIFA